MKRSSLTALFALAIPLIAHAQVPTAPSTSLDPGAAPSAPSTPAPTGPGKPNVVIVGPNGTVIGGDAQPAKKGYYTNSPKQVDTIDDDNAPVDVHAGPVPEVHVVRTGDTLWDICWFYFNDPWQWPKVWSYNAQVTNPHWIYPGDLIRLLPRGVFAQQENKLKDPEKTDDKKPDAVPPPQQKVDAGIKQVAFVEQSDLDRSITIEGAVDEKLLLGAGDEVYLSYPPNKPPVVGHRYSIYRPSNPVKIGDEIVGSYVRVLGALQVLSVKDKKRARGVITEANLEIERGAKVGPLLKQFHNVPPEPAHVDAQGHIVAMLKNEQLIGQGEVVFIDLGEKSGVEVGNRMFVVRRGDAMPKKMDHVVGQNDEKFPARALGEIMIVEVGKKISIALVTLAVHEMASGDFVMMQRAAAE